METAHTASTCHFYCAPFSTLLNLRRHFVTVHESCQFVRHFQYSFEVDLFDVAVFKCFYM